MSKVQDTDISGYNYHDPELNESHNYLLPAVVRQLTGPPAGRRLFDLGCGNGAVAEYLQNLGWDVVGVDPSTEGVAYANEKRSQLNIHVGSAYDDLLAKFGQFQFVVSLEVVEHLYAPRIFAANLYRLLEPGGIAIVSTPYHGYFKNLAIAITNKFDGHFTALWDHGHIKFWSVKTLRALLEEAGLDYLDLSLVGRVPPLAKSMVMTVRRPV